MKSPAATLLAAAYAQGGDVVAVIGTAKHAGKTAMIAAFLAEAQCEGKPCGLLSLGRDGEARDAFDEREKPRVFLHAGTLAVLPRSALHAGLHISLCEALPTPNALGELLVVRATANIAAEVTGPPSGAAMAEALGALRRHGAQLLFIDGALDRMAPLAAIDPVIVIATGMAAHADPERVAEQAAALVERMRLPPPPEHADLQIIDGVLDGARLRAVLATGDHRDLLIEDPLRMTHDAYLVARRVRGIWSKRRYRIAGCCVNAYAPMRSCDPQRLGSAVAATTRLPVVDCIAGKVYTHA